MTLSESAKRAPQGWQEAPITTPREAHTEPQAGEIFRAWIKNRARQSYEPESVLAVVRVERVTAERTGKVIILTAPDGSPIFRPFKTEAAPVQSWNAVSRFIPVETPPRATK